ncbi:MAG: adenylosuccinate lyase, partial [Flavobacteriales bacterium]
MELDPLTAISPIDGRYRTRTAPLAAWFSELALIRYRLVVEIHWFSFLCEIPLPELKGVKTAGLQDLTKRIAALSEPDARAVKAIERTTNHD